MHRVVDRPSLYETEEKELRKAGEKVSKNSIPGMFIFPDSLRYTNTAVRGKERKQW
jgi:hypothetical protein